MGIEMDRREERLSWARDAIKRGKTLFGIESTLNHERNRLDSELRFYQRELKNFSLPDDITPEQLAAFNYQLQYWVTQTTHAMRQIRALTLDGARWQQEGVDKSEEV